MSSLEERIQIRSIYTRSINLPRDHDNLERVRAYVPTTRAMQALERIAEGLGCGSRQRALALIGPYGAGKSAFALFLSALLAPGRHATHQAALEVLSHAQPALAARFTPQREDTRGFLRVPINGIPDSLVRQLLLALAAAAEQQQLSPALIGEMRAAAQPGTPLDQVMALVRRVQTLWAAKNGAGLLIEIDELGKLLEYAAYHPQHREIHLLQLLAEHAQEGHGAPLHVLVLLHQGFEQYSQRLSKQLRDEWHKVQGRFETLAFLEPAEQALRVIAATFAPRDAALAPELVERLRSAVALLDEAGALPLGLHRQQAETLLLRCYPLHPLTLLILPPLCQKVAQNERSLFAYLGSREPFGLRERLSRMQMGDWIEPWELYDYFILNAPGEFSDPLTHHRWVEVVTALERFDSPPDAAATRLLKTIGLLNLLGAQRGLKASPLLLRLLFGEECDALIRQLEAVSLIHFRHYGQEYRVWQGSDFDVRAALQQALAELGQRSLVEILNTLAPLGPLVARRATIKTGVLRCFVPGFTSSEHWPPRQQDSAVLRLWFYLAEDAENLPDLSAVSRGGLVAVCPFTERLRETVLEWMALQELPKRHAALHQDPVAQREYQDWLLHAEREMHRALRALLEEPELLRWFWAGEERALRDRRDLQRQLSDWVELHCYPQTPLLRNELLNWDQPSASANTGRKRLLAAMLSAADQDQLGIAKSPAEKSLYLSLLQATGLHRREAGGLGFYAPAADDPCHLRPVWWCIGRVLGDAGERRVAVPELYGVLRQPPYGMKLGVLPVVLVAYLLAHRREVALYMEGAFCESLTLEQVELLCRRPELFALERFDLAGLRGELFDRYLHSVVGRVRQDASLLDIVRPLMRFMAGLPEYALQCRGLSAEALRVRAVFQQAQSPGALLFEALPRACGVLPEDFACGDRDAVERFIQCLVGVLRELQGAYEGLLEWWRLELSRVLLDEAVLDLAGLRASVAGRYRGLEAYTPDRMGLGALIRRLVDAGHESDRAWLESVATLLGRVPVHKWREENRLQAQLRLREMGEQLRDLERLRVACADASGAEDAVLVKVVDARCGELSRVIHLSSSQWATAALRASELAGSLAGLDESVQWAVVARLLERFSSRCDSGDHHE